MVSLQVNKHTIFMGCCPQLCSREVPYCHPCVLLSAVLRCNCFRLTIHACLTCICHTSASVGAMPVNAGIGGSSDQLFSQGLFSEEMMEIEIISTCSKNFRERNRSKGTTGLTVDLESCPFPTQGDPGCLLNGDGLSAGFSYQGSRCWGQGH